MAAASVGSGESPRKASPAPNATRFATAAVLIPLVLLPAVLGGEWFVGLVVGVAAAAAWELATLQVRAGHRAYPVVAVLAAAALPLATAVNALAMEWLLLAAPLAVGLTLITSRLARGDALSGWAVSLCAGLYPGSLLAAAIALRGRPDGLGWILVVMIATWACDTAAFFVGRQWGRHKLAPALSPGKTVEGMLAGVAAGLAAGVVASIFIPDMPARTIGLALVVAIAAILGDLAESAIKRQLGAKDSGWLVPGHGGLLDRIDSLLFSGFLGYLYVALTDGVLKT